MQKGLTVGVFQLESGGMQELVRKLQPTSFEDITAVNALFRPGPLGAGMDQVYVDCKHGRRQVTYLNPCLEPILKETFGVILYQEQVMQIASAMGGFTMAEADTLRKAMGKKDARMMEELRVKFIEGAVHNSHTAKSAGTIYDEMAHFAQYGFNKSHSASYAVLSLQTAWLKANHPAEFMAANMSSEMRKADRITVLIDEVKSLGLTISPPDINDPRPEFSVQGSVIVFGMGAVKNVGVKAIEEIQAVHQSLGRDFRDLFDLCEQADLQKINRKVLEGLIHAGALDTFDSHRHEMIVNLDLAMAHGHQVARDRAQGQSSLFGAQQQDAIRPVMQPCESYDPLQRLSFERQAIGFFLSGHPFHEYREFIDALPVTAVCALDGLGEGTAVDLVGVVTSFSEARDKHKRVYARTHFEDLTGMTGVIVYARLYEEAADLVQGDSILVFSGRVRVRSDGKREVVADRVVHVDDAMAAWTREILLRLDLDNHAEEAIASLGEILRLQASEMELPRTQNASIMAEAGDPAAPRPVPLVVEAQRKGKRWLLRSQSHTMLLTLEGLRLLRSLPGSLGCCLRCELPPAATGPRGHQGLRQRRALT